VQSMLAVPLGVRDQALGVLAVHSRLPRAFHTDQVEVLTLLASLVTPDLEAAHMLESRDLQVRGLTALHDVAVAASGILDAETLGRLTVDRATDLLEVDSAVLRWWDERSGSLRLLASNDPHPDRHRSTISREQGVIGRAFREGRTITIGDDRHSETSLPGVAEDGVVTAMAVPLTVGQRTVGALAVATYKPHRYDQLQARLLNLFAAQVAPAIEAARLAAERERHHLVMRTLQQLGAAAGGIPSRAACRQARLHRDADHHDDGDRSGKRVQLPHRPSSRSDRGCFERSGVGRTTSRGEKSPTFAQQSDRNRSGRVFPSYSCRVTKPSVADVSQKPPWSEQPLGRSTRISMQCLQ